jgi:lysosomal acid lipase/cholesteryl ester hydrolase
LGNNRGNTYAHKHRKYRPDQDKYWDFSIDDFIAYDLPTSIEYVLKVTKSEKLSYIGFSQGTAQGFGCFASKVDLAEKINLFVALAPTTTVRGFNHRIVNAMINLQPEIVFRIFGRKAFLSTTLFWRRVLTKTLFTKLMDYSNKFLFGWTANNLLDSEKSALYNHIYSYTSVKAVAHWFQIQQAGRFQMYDDAQHGRGASYRPYRTPAYHLSNLKCPVALFYGGADTLPNFKSLLDELDPVYVRREPELEHLCFMWGKDCHTTIFPDVVRLLRQYDPLARSRPQGAPNFPLTKKDSSIEFRRDQEESDRPNGHPSQPNGHSSHSRQHSRQHSQQPVQEKDDEVQRIVGTTADPVPENPLSQE